MTLPPATCHYPAELLYPNDPDSVAGASLEDLKQISLRDALGPQPATGITCGAI